MVIKEYRDKYQMHRSLNLFEPKGDALSGKVIENKLKDPLEEAMVMKNVREDDKQQA